MKTKKEILKDIENEIIDIMELPMKEFIKKQDRQKKLIQQRKELLEND